MTTPYFYINPPFQFYPPFLVKNFEPPQVTQFLEGRTPPPPFKKGPGGSNYEAEVLHPLSNNTYDDIDF